MNFVSTALELYRAYNQHNLLYNGGETYDKLVTAEPLHITPPQLEEIKRKTTHVWQWLEEQRLFLIEADKNPELAWFKNLYQESLAGKTYEYQQLINKNITQHSEIIRVDLSSLPFGCHEAQLRWGIAGHMHFITKLFDQIVPFADNEIPINKNFAESIQKTIDSYVTNDDECAIFITTKKYLKESDKLVDELTNVYTSTPDTFNSSEFVIRGGKLIHHRSGKTVKVVFRRELTLETLLKSNFGENIVHLYLDGAVSFEPSLNLINDSKLGMALAFDERAEPYFSDESRSLFLPTSFYDSHMLSFNSVFNYEFDSMDDMLAGLSARNRKFVFKYGGSDLIKSFGAGSVYRLDRATKLTKRIINKEEAYSRNINEWIIQEMDPTKFKIKFLQGNYDDPTTCSVGTSENAAARIMIMAQKNRNKDLQTAEITSIIGNFVTDHWKARFKTSNTITGQGAVVTAARLVQQA